MRTGFQRCGAVGGVMWGALALAGCNSPGSFEAPETHTPNKIASFFAFGTTNPGPASKPVVEKITDCPEVDVLDGASAFRVYGPGGRSNADVRYQYSMGDVARECSVRDGRIAIKVGVEGRVLVGPMGSGGSFTVPVRIAIKRESDQKALASTLYRAPVTVASGETQGAFTIVSGELVAPYAKENSPDDYTIVVGFDQQGAGPATPRRKAAR